jgi:type IV pilus assembly protein PilW
MTRRLQYSLRRQIAGFTLIELMVSLLIGLVLTLAMFAVMATSEGQKRVTTGLNDIEQGGNIAMYQLDQLARSAGSGFRGAADYAYGCSLFAKSAAGQTLPLVAPLPAPFGAVNPDGAGQCALAPVIILPEATTPGISTKPSDALVIMGGAAGMGGAPMVMTAAPGSNSLAMNNTLAFNGNALLILTDPNGVTGGTSPCMLSQVSAGFTGGTATALPLSGNFYAATIGTTSVTGFSADTTILPIGTPDSNPPQFLVVGVGDNNTLFTYDLLQTAGAASALQARATGVFEMHAVYGVDTTGDGKLDSWVSPSKGDYALAQLKAGTPTALQRLQRIKAVRVALIMRTTVPEKKDIAPATIEAFSDLAGVGLNFSRALSGDELKYRYRVVDSTLIVRNNLMPE